MGKRHIKKGYRSLNAGKHHTIVLIEVLPREQNTVKPLCRLFGIPRSSYHYHVKHRELVCPERDKLSKQAIEIHRDSRGVARRELLQVNLINKVKMSGIIKQPV